MIAVIIREMSYLKALTPIIEEIHNSGAQYILYYMDNYKGDKEYSRPNLEKLKNANGDIVKNAHLVKSFGSDASLKWHLLKDNIEKMVSVEIFLWAKDYIKELKNIKTYSISYLSDSLWQKNKKGIDRVTKTYYSSKYLLEMQHKFLGVKIDESKSKFLGSPMFESIENKVSTGSDILVLLPNIRNSNVGNVFGGTTNFEKIIKNISNYGDLIFKTRKKQWLPGGVKKYAKQIVDDDQQMYPSKMAELLKQTCMTVMFYSSGIYECVYGGNYVLNIPIPLSMWSHDQENMKKYFSCAEGNLYSFSGVVESIPQIEVLQPNWKFDKKIIDPERRKEWMDRFIGNCPEKSSKEIVKDILSKT